MRHNPSYASNDPELLRQLVREHPWAVIVSNAPDGMVASHYPLLLDEDSDDLAVLTHLGRPDEKIHHWPTDREVLVIIQGHQGYVSPSWYAPGASQAPTWNFTAVHAHGVPELLDDRTNLAVLTRLVAHFERHVDDPMYLDPQWAVEPAKGTVGVRIPISRFVAKVKLSQDKDVGSVRGVIEHLRRPGPYANPKLADEVEAANSDRIDDSER